MTADGSASAARAAIAAFAAGQRRQVIATLVRATGSIADFSRVVVFEGPDDKAFFLAVSTATSLAFFAMVGFEDSVNMAEETREPSRIFPRILLTGLGITAAVYVLVSIVAVAVVPVGKLAESDTPLVTVVETAAPGFPINTLLPFISMFAVANTALINMMMASRLLYGMARQGVLPAALARVLPGRRTPWVAIVCTTAIAAGLIAYLSLDPENPVVLLLAGTTSLLLLSVFAVANAVVLVLRRDPVAHDHFRAPPGLPIVGVIACVYLVLPWTSGREPGQYGIALGLLGLGIVLWGVTLLANAVSGTKSERDLSDVG